MDTPTPPAPMIGQLLGEAVKAFRLNELEVGGKAASEALNKSRLYFSGKRVKPETEDIIVRAVAKAIHHSGLLRSPEGHAEESSSIDAIKQSLRISKGSIDAIEHSLRIFKAYIESMLNVLRTRNYVSQSIPAGLHGCFRLACIDSALRLAALDLLGQISITEPTWIEPGGWAELLEEFISHWESQHAFAKAIGVDDSSLSRWKSSEQDISEDNLGKMARVQATLENKQTKPEGHNTPETVGSFTERLRQFLRQYRGLSIIAKRLCSTLGEVEVKASLNWMVGAAFDLSKLLMQIFKESTNHEHNKALLFDVMLQSLEGSRAHLAKRLLESLVLHTEDAVRKEDLNAVLRGYSCQRVSTYCYADNVSTQFQASEGVREKMLCGPDAQIKFLRFLQSRGDDSAGIQSIICETIGASYRYREDHEKALEYFTKAVDFDRENWNARHWLGMTCGVLAKLDECSRHLKAVYEANPHDPAPLWKLAWYLNENGQSKAAQDLLEPYADTFIYNDPDFGCELGRSRLENDDIVRALQAYEAAIKLNPFDPEALDEAAECCYKLFAQSGAKHYRQRCDDYRKRANELGLNRVFQYRRRMIDERK